MHPKYPNKKINSSGGTPFVALCLLLCAVILADTIQYKEKADAESVSGGVVVEESREPPLIYSCNVCHRVGE